MSKSLIVSSACALLLAACNLPLIPAPLSTPTKSTTQSLPALEGDWMISFTHSGGIMGLMRSIEISATGNFSLIDENAGETINGRLSLEEISRLRELVASAKYRPLASPEQSQCADCFIYGLEIVGNGKTFSTQLDDISLTDSGLETLINYLRTLLENSLK